MHTKTANSENHQTLSDISVMSQFNKANKLQCTTELRENIETTVVFFGRNYPLSFSFVDDDNLATDAVHL